MQSLLRRSPHIRKFVQHLVSNLPRHRIHQLDVLVVIRLPLGFIHSKKSDLTLSRIGVKRSGMEFLELARHEFLRINMQVVVDLKSQPIIVIDGAKPIVVQTIES